MKRKDVYVRNTSSLVKLRFYALAAVVVLFLILVAMLATGLILLNGVDMSLKQVHVNGQRQEYSAFGAVLGKAKQLIGVDGWLADLKLPGLNEKDLSNYLHENGVNLMKVHMALTLGDDYIDPLSDEHNVKNKDVPNVLVDYFFPKVITLHAAVCFVMHLY